MKRLKYIYVFAMFLLLRSAGIYAQYFYRNNDSTAIVSTHRSRPFKYGYAYSREECEQQFRSKVKQFGFKKGDVVADIGAASGWKDGAYSVFTDSVTFYIQDINRVFLNKKQFKRVVRHYSEVRGSPQTNKFYFVIGTKRKTRLPEAIFDKILFDNAFHEVEEVDAILDDIIKKLKPNGKIIITEQFSSNDKAIRHNGCGIVALKVSKVENILNSKGFYLTRASEPKASFSNHLTFERNKKKADEFHAKIKSLEEYEIELSKLAQTDISGDSLSTLKIAGFLKEHLHELEKVYTTTEEGINSLGYDYLRGRDYDRSINVLKVNQILYPSSGNVFDSLGEAYMEKGEYKVALGYYQKSLSLSPENTNAKIRISKLKKLMNGN